MKKIRVIVEVSEGVATVYTDDPERLDVVIVDYDTDGVDVRDLRVLAGDAERERVLLSFDRAERAPKFDALWESIQYNEAYAEPDA
jgi:hypothetical protein